MSFTNLGQNVDLPCDPFKKFHQIFFKLLLTAEVYEEVDGGIEDKTDIVNAGHAENARVGVEICGAPGDG